MTYRNNISNKKSLQVQPYLPYAGQSAALAPIPANQAGCGGIPVIGTDYAAPGLVQGTQYIPGSQQALTHDVSLAGTHVFPSTLPVLPAAGAVTASSPAAPHVPVLPGAIPAQAGVPISDQVPSTLQNTFFTPGFLRTQIGRRMRVEFLLGTNLLTDRTGTLAAVGASYIVLRLVDSDDLMMCDIFSIKFVTIIL